MIVRFNITNNGIEQQEIARWMNKHIGLIEEGKTWFWDTKLDRDSLREGIRIWKDVPAVSLAIIKWGVAE